MYAIITQLIQISYQCVLIMPNSKNMQARKQRTLRRRSDVTTPEVIRRWHPLTNERTVACLHRRRRDISVSISSSQICP